MKLMMPPGPPVASVEAEPPRRLVIRWQHQNKPELKAARYYERSIWQLKALSVR